MDRLALTTALSLAYEQHGLEGNVRKVSPFLFSQSSRRGLDESRRYPIRLLKGAAAMVKSGDPRHRLKHWGALEPIATRNVVTGDAFGSV
jgi:hypothetical protein